MIQKNYFFGEGTVQKLKALFYNDDCSRLVFKQKRRKDEIYFNTTRA